VAKIKLFANLREAANGQRIVEYSFPQAVSTAELLQRLVDDYGEKARRLVFCPSGGISPSIVVMRNGEMLRDRDEKAIAPDDEVAILLPVAGG
jgi:molybdopterin converting factor small subunit